MDNDLKTTMLNMQKYKKNEMRWQIFMRNINLKNIYPNIDNYF